MSGRITPRGGLILLEKELRLLFKNKRRIFILTVIPIIIILMGLVIGFTADDTSEDLGPIRISILDENPTNVTNSLKSYWSTINDTELVEISGNFTEIIETRDFQVLVFIPANFTSLILNENITTIDIVYNTNSTEYGFVAFDLLILTNIFEDQMIRSNNPDVNFDLIEPNFNSITSVIGDDPDAEDETDDELIALLVVVPVYIIFFVVISPMSLILISVTIEREQKTLETLFLQPVKRRDIVLGKIYYGLALVLITILLDLIAAILAALIAILVSGNDLSEILDVASEQYDNLGLFIIFGFIVALLVISVNIIAFAVLLSLLAKDEREANMISGLLPMLIFGMVGFIFIVPVDEFATIYQALIVSLPVIGVIVAIYLSGLAGSIIWVAYLSIVAQIIWAYFIINLITRISESESIIELSYSVVFRQIKRFILRR